MSALYDSVSWLEPLLIDPIPADLVAMADQMLALKGRLEGLYPAETADRIGQLLQLTNSFYSNLIEGQYTEPKAIEQTFSQTAHRHRRLPRVCPARP